ncbi:MAG: SpoIIE family protein phosphatase [Gallionella sp.]|nr:SpoIIE family protein phosphatase [Gallionella sp.]
MLHSDGLVDAQNAQHENFGEERLIASMRGHRSHYSLKEAVLTHLDGRDAGDDISIDTISLHEDPHQLQ